MTSKNLSSPYQTPLNFAKLVCGQAVSVFGTALLRFALSLYVLDITGRADLYATLFAISSIPVLFAPIAGVLADRFNRKVLMVGLDLANGLISLGLLISLALNQQSLIVISVAMVLFGLIGAMDTPIVSALLPSIAQEDGLESANGILQAVQSLSGIVAPVLGGILYSMFGITMIVVVTTLVFFLTAILEMTIAVKQHNTTYSGSLIKTLSADFIAGFHYTMHHDFIRKTMLISMGINLVLTPLFIVGVPYILRVTMALNANLYGVGIAVIEFAIILGALLIGRVTKILNVATFYQWIFFMAVLLIPIALATTPLILNQGSVLAFTIFTLGCIPLAASLSIVSIFAMSKIQKITPSEHLGKVMALLMSASQLAAPLGQVIYGQGLALFPNTVAIPILISGFATFLLSLACKHAYRHQSNI